MTRRLLAVLLSLFCAVAQANGVQWMEGSVLGVPVGNAKNPMAIFANSYTQAGPPAGVWTPVYVEQHGVPGDAIAVYLSGILIITHGTTAETADLTVAFRACGNDLPAAAYSGQVVEAHVGGGQRSGVSTWVPLSGACFEWQWNRSTSGTWPTNSAYGINLSMQAYVRPAR